MKSTLHPSHSVVSASLPPDILTYPERVLQFGTGVLLRGLPDFIIDQANKKGLFRGRVVVVKSTTQGSSDAFAEQGGLYTVCLRGWEGAQAIEENHVVSSISRVLSADQDWATILALASEPQLDIIISNTTEIGIQLVEENVFNQVPTSFPGKVLAYLHARYKAFAGDPSKGMVIIPTELISENGTKLAQILRELADINQLDTDFIQWLENANIFCNSLVDRIVPGRPQGPFAQQIEDELPYQDGLSIVAEPYALWAIQGDASLQERLSFCQAQAGAVLHPSIEKFKELKLRLLNGPHSISCGLAFLSGFKTVKEAMADKAFTEFIQQVSFTEIAPAIPSHEITQPEAHTFAQQVLDRFRNPYLDHFWLSISLQYTQKLCMRILPVLERYIAIKQEPPRLMSLGFAAYLHLMRVNEAATGHFKGEPYILQDPMTKHFAKWYAQGEPIVYTALRATTLWGKDLSELPGWEEAVQEAYDTIQNQLDTQGAIDLSTFNPNIA